MLCQRSLSWSPSSGKRNYQLETSGKKIVLVIFYFNDLYGVWETFATPETCLSCCQLHPFKCNTVISTGWCPISSSSETLWDWWLHVNLSNFGVCSKLVWKTEHTGKEEIDGDNIPLIISLRIFVAQIFMGKLSFQIKLIYTSYHKSRTVSYMSQRLRGQWTLHVCHPIHCPTRH